MTRALMIGAAAAALSIGGCAMPPPPHYAGPDPYAYPPAAYHPGGGLSTSPVAVTAMQPIPDTPENRARYGGPQSRAGQRTAYERPY